MSFRRLSIRDNTDNNTNTNTNNNNRHTANQLTMDSFLKNTNSRLRHRQQRQRRTSTSTKPSFSTFNSPAPTLTPSTPKPNEQQLIRPTVPSSFTNRNKLHNNNQQQTKPLPSSEDNNDGAIADDAWKIGQAVFQQTVIDTIKPSNPPVSANTNIVEQRRASVPVMTCNEATASHQRRPPYGDDDIIVLSNQSPSLTSRPHRSSSLSKQNLPTSPAPAPALAPVPAAASFQSPRTPTRPSPQPPHSLRSVFDDNDDDDFESDTAKSAPAFKRTPTRLDDRPSMTRRSTKKAARKSALAHPRRRRIMNRTFSSSDEGDDEEDEALADDNVVRRHIFEGNHSELSSDTDNGNHNGNEHIRGTQSTSDTNKPQILSHRRVRNRTRNRDQIYSRRTSQHEALMALRSEKARKKIVSSSSSSCSSPPPVSNLPVPTKLCNKEQLQASTAINNDCNRANVTTAGTATDHTPAEFSLSPTAVRARSSSIVAPRKTRLSEMNDGGRARRRLQVRNDEENNHDHDTDDNVHVVKRRKTSTAHDDADDDDDNGDRESGSTIHVRRANSLRRRGRNLFATSGESSGDDSLIGVLEKGTTVKNKVASNNVNNVGTVAATNRGGGGSKRVVPDPPKDKNSKVGSKLPKSISDSDESDDGGMPMPCGNMKKKQRVSRVPRKRRRIIASTSSSSGQSSVSPIERDSEISPLFDNNENGNGNDKFVSQKEYKESNKNEEGSHLNKNNKTNIEDNDPFHTPAPTRRLRRSFSIEDHHDRGHGHGLTQYKKNRSLFIVKTKKTGPTILDDDSVNAGSDKNIKVKQSSQNDDNKEDQYLQAQAQEQDPDTTAAKAAALAKEKMGFDIFGNISSDSDVDAPADEAKDEEREDEEDEETPYVTRSRSSSKRKTIDTNDLFSLTQSPPSPPSSRKKGRLNRLQVLSGSSDLEHESIAPLVHPSYSTPERKNKEIGDLQKTKSIINSKLSTNPSSKTVAIQPTNTIVNKYNSNDNHESNKKADSVNDDGQEEKNISAEHKSSEWFNEREIDQFSSSSSADNVVGTGSGNNSTGAGIVIESARKSKKRGRPKRMPVGSGFSSTMMDVVNIDDGNDEICEYKGIKNNKISFELLQPGQKKRNDSSTPCPRVRSPSVLTGPLTKPKVSAGTIRALALSSVIIDEEISDDFKEAPDQNGSPGNTPTQSPPHIEVEDRDHAGVAQDADNLKSDGYSKNKEIPAGASNKMNLCDSVVEDDEVDDGIMDLIEDDEIQMAENQPPKPDFSQHQGRRRPTTIQQRLQTALSSSFDDDDKVVTCGDDHDHDDDIVVNDGDDEFDDDEPLMPTNHNGNRRATEIDAGPPPFFLEAMCQPGENIDQMMDRVGESEVLERVSQAQHDGRKIIGGEHLGITESDSNDQDDVFSQFSKTVVAGQLGRDKKVQPVTEKALRGEYEFYYRGKERDQNKSTDGGHSGRGGRRVRRARGTKKRSTSRRSSASGTGAGPKRTSGRGGAASTSRTRRRT